MIPKKQLEDFLRTFKCRFAALRAYGLPKTVTVKSKTYCRAAIKALELAGDGYAMIDMKEE